MSTPSDPPSDSGTLSVDDEIEASLAAERARVQALQEEIAKLRNQLSSTPPPRTGAARGSPGVKRAGSTPRASSFSTSPSADGSSPMNALGTPNRQSPRSSPRQFGRTTSASVGAGPASPSISTSFGDPSVPDASAPIAITGARRASIKLISSTTPPTPSNGGVSLSSSKGPTPEVATRHLAPSSSSSSTPSISPESTLVAPANDFETYDPTADTDDTPFGDTSFDTASPAAGEQAETASSSTSSTSSATVASPPPAAPAPAGFSAASLMGNMDPTERRDSTFNLPPRSTAPGMPRYNSTSVLPRLSSDSRGSTLGYSASSLLAMTGPDTGEMLKANAANAGLWTAPSIAGGEESTLIDSSAAVGALPSLTPAMSVGGGTREKGVDRVEDDLVFFSKNFQILLKGGTVAKIIERLTAETQADNSVVDTFLLTYRKFISPENFLEHLFRRYNMPPPVSDDELDAHSLQAYEHSLKIVRLRVGNLIKRWLTEQSQDFRGNETLIDRLEDLCRQTFLKNEKSLGEKILTTLHDMKQKISNAEPGRNMAASKGAANRPESIIPKGSSFEDFDIVEMARQICLYEQSIFVQIHPMECLDQCWSTPQRYQRAPFMMKLIDFFNAFSQWVATTVLKYSKLDDRVKVVKKFMRLAIELYYLNNYNGCYEVLAGLSESSVHRLRVTWMKVEKDAKLMAEFKNAKDNLSPDRSWFSYRALLKSVNPPCIPYLGMYQTDLTFIEDGNPNYLKVADGRKDIINFEKCRKQALVIGNILLYQQDLYQFERVDIIYNFFANGLQYESDKNALHQLSRSIETQDMVEEAKRKTAKKEEKEKKRKSDKKPDPRKLTQSGSGSMVRSQSTANIKSIGDSSGFNSRDWSRR